MATMEDSTTPSRLKRLSLVPSQSRSSIRKGGDSIDSTSSTSTTVSSASASSTDVPGDASSSTIKNPTPSAQGYLSSSPLSPLALKSARSPRHSVRSSISYSTSTPVGLTLPKCKSDEASTELPRSHRRSTQGTLSPTLPQSGSLSPARAESPALTLAERHADLLRMIAMRERRVNELKQELATQEAALSSLRNRWTSIARTEHTLPTAAQPPPPANLARTTSSTSTTHSSVPEETEADGSPLNAIWSAIAQDADETIQEGKRFWGQLVKTVSAAAGGTVPEEGDHGNGSGKRPLTGGGSSLPGLSSFNLGSLTASMAGSGGGNERGSTSGRSEGSGREHKRRGSSSSRSRTTPSPSPRPLPASLGPNLAPSRSNARQTSLERFPSRDSERSAESRADTEVKKKAAPDEEAG